MSTVRGFDNIRYDHDLLLCLPFREAAGTVTRDWSKVYRPMTFGGAPTWTNLDNDLTVLDFADPAEITCPGADSADLDFTSGDFSLAVWAYHDDIGSAHVIANRAQLNACGWEWYTATGNLALRTNQAASREGAAAVGCIVTGTWQFLGVTRIGLAAQMYIAGQPFETSHTDNGLLDPVACGVQTFRVANNPNTNYFDGMMWGLRIWNRALAAVEMATIYDTERDLFGV